LKHHHLLEVACAFWFQAILSIKFYGECVLIAAYLINYTTKPKLFGKIPYEMLFTKPPSYSHLCVFGCLCYLYDKNQFNDKFSPYSKPCIFICYPMRKKDVEFVTWNHIKFLHHEMSFFFYKNQFPFHSHNPPKELNVVVS
jgi:hypothetical protein